MARRLLLIAGFAMFATGAFAQTEFSVTPDIVSVPVGQPTTFTVLLTNNSLPIPAPITATVVSGPNAGTPVNDQGNGVFSYTGNNFGTDTVEFTATVLSQPITVTAMVTWVGIQCGVQPDPAGARVGDFVQLTATIIKDGALAEGVTVNYVVSSGPNQGRTGQSSTNASGQALIGYTSNGTIGTDNLTLSGSIDGVPFTCPATVNWLDLVCSADEATGNLINTEYTHTVNISSNGQPVAGITVGFSVSGTNAGITDTATTDAAGDARFRYTSSVSGRDTITANAIVGGVSTACATDLDWTSSGCSASPTTAAVQINTPHFITLTVLVEGAPVANSEVVVTRTGANGPLPANTTLTTDQNGQATFSYTGTNIGEDIVSFAAEGEFCGGIVVWRDLQVTVDPAAATLQVGGSHAILATVTYNGQPAVGAIVDLDVDSGPNAGASDSVVADSAGQATLNLSSNGNQGLDQLSISARHASVGNAAPATVDWKVGACNLTPGDAIAEIGAQHSVDIDVTLGGVPQSGASIDAQVTRGPNIGASAQLTSDGSGRARFTYAGNGGPGVDTISINSDIGGVVFSCEATVEWISVGCFAVNVLHAPVGTATHALFEITRNGQPAQGVDLAFTIVSGPNAGLQIGNQTTGLGGAALVLVPDQADTGGTDLLRASGSVDGITLSCDVSIHWQTTGASTLLPLVLQPTTGSTVAIPALLIRDDVPAPGTFTFDVVRGPNVGAMVPVPTQSTGLAVWSFTDDNLGLSHVHARTMVEGTPASGVVGANWIDGPAGGFDPLFATNGTGQHSTTLTVEDNFEPVTGLTVNVAIIGGPNQGISQQHTTDGNGQITFTYTGDGRPGIDLIVATATFPAGTATWNALVEWTAIDCNLTAPAFAQVGQPVDIQLDLLSEGVPVEGETVDFNVFGINNGTSGQVTVSGGQATIRYTGGVTPGNDTVTVSGTIGGRPFSCDVALEWIDVQCDLSPATTILLTGDEAILEAFVSRNGIEVPGLSVTVEGADDPGPARATVTRTTGEEGFFDIFLNSETPEQRTVTISGAVDGVPFSCSSTVEWVDLSCSLAVSASPLAIGNEVTITPTVLRNGVPVTPNPSSWSITNGPHLSTIANSATFSYTGTAKGIDSVQFNAMFNDLPVSCNTTVDWRDISCSIASNPDPEIQIGGNHQATVNVLSDGAPASGITINFVVTAGPNAGFTGSAVSNGFGQASFSYSGSTIGVDQFTATGNVNGAALSCSDSVEWVEYATSLAPETQQLPINQTASLTLTLTRNGVPHEGGDVFWSINSGPNSLTPQREVGIFGDFVTDANGQGTISYNNVVGFGGTDTVVANLGIQGINGVFATADVEWIDYHCNLLPQAATVTIDSQHLVSCQVMANGVPVPGASVDFAITNGPHAGNTLTVFTNDDGIAIYTYTGTSAGTDTIQASGSVDGEPFSCSTTATWEIGATCTLSPIFAHANIATNHTLTLTLVDDGTPIEGAPITFNVIDGPNAGASHSGTTSVAGVIAFSYLGSTLGTDTIVATGPAGAICSAAVTWIDAECAIALDPAIYSVGDTATIPVTLSKNGLPAQGVSATLNVTSGPNAGVEQTLVSDTNGDIFFTYTGSANHGVDAFDVHSSIDGVALTCSDSLAWIDVACSVAPADTNQQIGNNQTFTVTLTKNGAPVPGHSVLARRVPGNTSLGTLTTDENGSASVTISSNTVGFDNVYFNASLDGVSTECFGNVNWIDVQCGVSAPATAQVGDDVSATLLLQKNGAPVFEGPVSWSILSGPNAGAATLNTTTDGNGQSTFSYTSILTGGTDTIQATGIVDGVPYVCTHAIELVDIQCSLTPIASTMHLGQQQNIGITVTRNGVPQPGIAADFAIETGPHSGDGAGQVENFNYTGEITGTDRVIASGQFQGIDFSCDIDVSWITLDASVEAHNPKAQINTDFPITVTVLKNGTAAPGVDVQLGPGLVRVGNITDANGQVTIIVNNPTVGNETFFFQGTVDGVPFNTQTTVEFVDLQCSLTPGHAFYQIGSDATLDLGLTLNGEPVLNPSGSFLVSAGPNSGQSTTGSSFTYTSNGNVGQDSVGVSGTHDGVTFSCDALVDFADVQCSLSPATAIADADGSAHDVELTLSFNGSPAANATATITIKSGDNAGFADSATTDSSGKLIFSLANTAGTFNTDSFEVSGDINGIAWKCPSSVRWLRADCSANPADADVVEGFDHTVTFTVFEDGAPAPGVSVDISGPVTQQLTSDGAGQVSVTWQPNLGPRSEQIITASGQIQGVPFSASSTARIVPNAECSFANSAITRGINDDVSFSLSLQQNGEPLAGHPVTFLVTGGPNAGATQNTSTDEAGNASFTYTAGPTFGTDTIVASGTFLNGNFSCQATAEIIDAQCELVGDILPVGEEANLSISLTRNGQIVTGEAGIEVISGPNVGQTASDYISNGVAGTDSIQVTALIDGVEVTCLGSMQWIDYGCDLQPANAIAEASASVTITALFDRDGVPAAGESVTWHTGATGVTDENGQASITINGPGTPSNETVTATAVLDGNTVTCETSIEFITIDCELTALNSPLPVDDNANINAVLRRNGVGISGIAVDFEVISGPNAGVVGGGNTGDGGTISFGYSGANGFGTDIIEFRATVDGVETSCQTSQRWIDISCEVVGTALEAQIGDSVTLTATVRVDGQLAPGLAISANTGDSGTTDGNGRFSVQVTDNTIGVKSIVFDTSSEGIASSCEGSVEFVDVTCELNPPAADLLDGDGSFVNTAVIRRNGVAVDGVDVTFSVSAGPNTGATGTVATDTNGESDFSYLADGGVGEDTLEISGNVNGVAFSCSAARSIRSLPSCSLSPDGSSAQSGGQHSVTVTITQDGQPYVGDISFAVTSGPNTGQTHSTTTDANGNATFTYTSNGTAGTDIIEATGDYVGNAFNCSASHEWFDVYSCQVNPSHQVAQIGSNAQIIVTLLRNGVPHAGGQINDQTTDEGGEATFSFSSNTVGTETYNFLGDGDSQCSATVEWVDLQLVLTPQNQFQAVGGDATFNASITRNGAAVTGEMVDLSVDSGPNAGHSDAANSPATFSYPGNGGNGTDQVSASATVEGVFLEAFAQAGFLNVECQVLLPGAKGAVGVEYIIQTQVTLNGAPAVARDLTFSITAGPHNGQTHSATTDNQGLAEFAITGTAAGTDTIEVSGNINGVAYSCGESFEWVDVPSCSVAPASALVELGTSHSVTVSYIANSAIRAEVVSGPNVGDSADLTTDGDGNATFTYTGDGGTGEDSIEFYADFLGADVSCHATADWQTIDCQLVAGSAVVGRNATVTLTLLRNGVEPIPSVLANFAIDQGPNAPITQTIQTDANGQATVTYLGQGGIGQDRALVMGTVDGINFQCEDIVDWLSGIGCTFSPEQDSANSCATQTVNLAVLNDGDPVANSAVVIDVISGPHIGFNTTVTTNAQGRASFDLVGDGQIGTDTIQATVNLNNVQESCTATREWTNEPPVISCPDDITCNSLNPNGGTVWWDILATDDCDTPTIECTPPAGSQFPLGTTVVTCTATDSHGAQSSCTFNVTITDTIPDELLGGLRKINPEGPVRMDSPLLVDMERAFYETVEVGSGHYYEGSVRASLQHFFMGKSTLTVGDFLELGNFLVSRQDLFRNLRFNAAGDIFYGDVQLFSMAANNNVSDSEGRVLFDYGLRFNGNGYFLQAEFIRVKLFGDANLPQNGGNPDIQSSGTDCDELLAIENFPILGISWYGGAFLANIYSRYAKGLSNCDLAYAIGLTAEEWRPNHLTPAEFADGFDPAEQQEWVERFPFAYRMPTYQEFVNAGQSQGIGNGFATHNGGNYFNSDDFFDNGPTPVGYYYPLDHYPINDLSGNVWEWLTEQGPERASAKAITGGSWYNSQNHGQVGGVFSADPNSGFSDVGLRFVATHDFRFRGYLREANQPSFDEPQQFQGHVYYPYLQPGTDYIWEAEFTHDGLEGPLGWMTEASVARAEAAFSTTGQQPTSAALNANGGWNLMSITIEPALCHSKFLFGADTTVWAWNPILQIYEYEPGAVIEPFKGYWVHFPSTIPTTIHGFEPESTEITLRRFYNLIGPAQDNFDIDNIDGRLGPAYGYLNGEFGEADVLNLGHAYFIFVSRPSVLELNPAPAPNLTD